MGGHATERTCKGCGKRRPDTLHLLECERHADAVEWLWDLGDWLSNGDQVERSVEVLLGGRIPHEVLGGVEGKARVWHCARVALLHVMHSWWWSQDLQTRNSQFSYAAGDMVALMIRSLRDAVRQDWDRVIEGCVDDDGIPMVNRAGDEEGQGRNASAGRLRRRFYNVWCGEGRQLVEWGEDVDVDGQVQGNVRERRRVRILISESFPVGIRGDRLLHDDMG